MICPPVSEGTLVSSARIPIGTVCGHSLSRIYYVFYRSSQSRAYQGRLSTGYTNRAQSRRSGCESSRLAGTQANRRPVAGYSRGWPRFRARRTYSLSGAYRRPYLRFQRGGEYNSLPLSVYRSAAHSHKARFPLSHHGGSCRRDDEELPSYWTGFCDAEHATARSPAQGDPDLLPLHASCHLYRSFFAPRGCAQSCLGRQEESQLPPQSGCLAWASLWCGNARHNVSGFHVERTYCAYVGVLRAHREYLLLVCESLVHEGVRLIGKHSPVLPHLLDFAESPRASARCASDGDCCRIAVGVGQAPICSRSSVVGLSRRLWAVLYLCRSNDVGVPFGLVTVGGSPFLCHALHSLVGTAVRDQGGPCNWLSPQSIVG